MTLIPPSDSHGESSILVESAQSEFTLLLEATVREHGVIEVLEHLISLCDVLDWESTSEEGWSYAADALADAADKIDENDERLACEGAADLTVGEDACND